jgi:succinyl-diaminopimelate desuccinylase
MAVVTHLSTLTLDSGTDQFDPSHLEVTTIDVGNPTSNVIPGAAQATFNVRFNPTYTLESLQQFLAQHIDVIKTQHDSRLVWDVSYRLSSEAFLKSNPVFNDAAVAIVKKHTGLTPTLSTTGGTSDARFMKDLCPVLEFGLLSCYAHHANERAAIADLKRLTDIYTDIILHSQRGG